MNAITTTQDTKAIAPYGAGSLVPRNMDEAIRLAEFMARARTVPKHLWDSPGDCLMIVELAMRWQMSPFAVAQATSVISGKQMIEGKLVAAAVESVGAIVGQFDYEFSGEGEERAITVSATRRGETNPRTVIVKLADAKTANQMWTKQPDQQLVYHGVRVWARRWTPAVILGVYSREEMGPIVEGEAVEVAPASPERQAINDAVPLKPAAAATPRAERKVDPTVYEPPPGSTAPEKRTWAQWRDALELAAKEATTPEERGSLLARAEVGEIVRLARLGPYSPAKARIIELYEEIENRYLADPPDPPEADDLPEVDVIGAEKAAAGD